MTEENVLRNIFPGHYTYFVAEEDNESKYYVLRVSLKDEKDVITWVRCFESTSHTRWILHNAGSRTPKRMICHKYWVCHLSSRNKTSRTKSEMDGCKASLDIKIKKITPDTTRRDAFLKLDPPLNAVIRINFQHNHALASASNLVLLRPSSETVNAFQKYFDDGLAPAQAMRLHESKILLTPDPYTKLANATFNPTRQWVYYQYKRWKKNHLGDELNTKEKKNIFSEKDVDLLYDESCGQTQSITGPVLFPNKAFNDTQCTPSSSCRIVANDNRISDNSSTSSCTNMVTTVENCEVESPYIEKKVNYNVANLDCNASDEANHANFECSDNSSTSDVDCVNGCRAACDDSAEISDVISVERDSTITSCRDTDISIVITETSSDCHIDLVTEPIYTECRTDRTDNDMDADVGIEITLNSNKGNKCKANEPLINKDESIHTNSSGDCGQVDCEVDAGNDKSIDEKNVIDAQLTKSVENFEAKAQEFSNGDVDMLNNDKEIKITNVIGAELFSMSEIEMPTTIDKIANTNDTMDTKGGNMIEESTSEMDGTAVKKLEIIDVLGTIKTDASEIRDAEIDAETFKMEEVVTTEIAESDALEMDNTAEVGEIEVDNGAEIEEANATEMDTTEIENADSDTVEIEEAEAAEMEDVSEMEGEDSAEIEEVIETDLIEDDVDIYDTEIIEADSVETEAGNGTETDEADFIEAEKTDITETEDADATETGHTDDTEAEEADDTEAEKADATVVEEADATVAEEADATLAEEADATLAEEADATLAEEADATLAEEADATLAEEADATLAEEADATLAEEADATLAEETGATEGDEALETEIEEGVITEMEGTDATKMEGVDATEMEEADATEMEGADATEMEGADATEMEGADATEMEGADDTEMEGADDTEMEGADDTEMEGADDTEMEGADDTEMEGVDDIEMEGADDTEMEGADATKIKKNTIEMEGTDTTEVEVHGSQTQNVLDNSKMRKGINHKLNTNTDLQESVNIENVNAMDCETKAEKCKISKEIENGINIKNNLNIENRIYDSGVDSTDDKSKLKNENKDNACVQIVDEGHLTDKTRNNSIAGNEVTNICKLIDSKEELSNAKDLISDKSGLCGESDVKISATNSKDTFNINDIEASRSKDSVGVVNELTTFKLGETLKKNIKSDKEDEDTVKIQSKVKQETNKDDKVSVKSETGLGQNVKVERGVEDTAPDLSAVTKLKNECKVEFEQVMSDEDSNMESVSVEAILSALDKELGSDNSNQGDELKKGQDEKQNVGKGNILKRSSEAESCVDPKKSKIALEEDTKCNSSKMCETLGGDDQFSKDLLKEEMKAAKDKVTDVDVECSSEKKIKKVPVAKKKTGGYAKRPSSEQQNTNCNVNDRVVENTSCDRVENTSCEVSDEDHSDYDDVTMGGDDFHYSDNSDSESTTLQEKESDKENADLSKSVESKTDRTSSERVITSEASAEKKKVKKGPTLGDDSISEDSSGSKKKLNSGTSNDIEKPKPKSLKKKRTADTCSNSSSEIKKMRATDKSSDCGEKVLSNKENEDNLLKEFRSNLDSVIDDVVAKAKEDAMTEELYIGERAHIKEAVKRICDKIPEMTRYDMEKYISVKVVEHIAHRAAIGQLRERVQLVESTCDALKKKSSCIEKQNRDLDMVSKKFYNDIKLKRYPNNLTLPTPAKITRSVGLQVHFTSPYVRPGFPGHRSSSTSNFPVTELLVRTIPSSGSSSSPGQETALPSSQTPPTDQSAAAKKQKSTLGVPSQNKTLSKLTPSSSEPNLHKASPPQKQNVPPKTQPSKPGAPTMKPAGQAKPASQMKPSPLSSKQIPSVVKTSTPSKQPMKPASTPSPVRGTSVSANGNPQSLKVVVSTNNIPQQTGPRIRVASPAILQKRVVKPGVSPSGTAANASPAPLSVAQARAAKLTSGGMQQARQVKTGSDAQARLSAPTNASNVSPQKPKTNQDSKVIDLTDEDDRAKRTAPTLVKALGKPAVSPQVTPRPVQPGSIRVVQPHQLSAGACNITSSVAATGTVGSTGQRVTYYLPTSAATASGQRQLLIASSPNAQVRAGSLMTSNRPQQLPALFLKNGTIVPVQQGMGLQGGTPMLRTSAPMTGVQLQQVMGSRGSQFRVTQLPPNTVTTVPSPAKFQHPAPLPPTPSYQPMNPNWKLAPPRPDLRISRVNNKEQQGIVLSWNMSILGDHEEIASYQLYAYQESSAPPSTTQWKKVGDVKALPLPMACTLTQFMEGHKYHFAVRAMDIHSRLGPFSTPGFIVLTRK